VSGPRPPADRRQLPPSTLPSSSCRRSGCGCAFIRRRRRRRRSAGVQERAQWRGSPLISGDNFSARRCAWRPQRWLQACPRGLGRLQISSPWSKRARRSRRSAGR